MVFSSFTRTPDMVSVVFSDTFIRLVVKKNTSDLDFDLIVERKLPEGVIEGGEVKEEQTLTLILSDLVEEGKLKRKQVQFLVPDPFVVIRKILLPADLLPDEIRGHLFMEIGSTIHLPFENPVFDFVLVDNVEENSILFFAAPLRVVQMYRDILADAGLKPKLVEVSALSLYRYFKRESAVFEEDHAMILHIDEGASTASIFHQNMPVFMRPIDLSFEEEYLETSFGNVDVSVKMATVFKEFEKVMNFYQFSLNQGEVQLTKLLFAGDHPKLREIAEHFSERVELPFHMMESERVSGSDETTVTEAFTAVVGLALRGGR